MRPHTPQRVDIGELMATCTSVDDRLNVAYIGRSLHLLSKIAREETRKPDWQIVQITELVDKTVQQITCESVRRVLVSYIAGSKAHLYVAMPGNGSVVDTTV